MGQSSLTIDRQIYTGTAASSGGTFVVNYGFPTPDQCYYLRATLFGTVASGTHLTGSALLVAECVFEAKNSVLSIVGFLGSSNNPSNSNTTTFVAAHAQASDFVASGALTLVWTVATPNAVLTFANVGNPASLNCTAIIDIMNVGST